MRRIHPTAIVEDGARIGAGVGIGAFSIVGRDVTLGDGVTLESHVVIEGRTTVGQRTRINAFSVIGGEPQDLAYRGEATEVEIGPDCIIREHVTIHRGTSRGRGKTTVGAHCFFMVAAHVAHDCVVGDRVILTNQATLGGHTVVGEYAILGGLAAVQQRSRVGAHAFIGGVTAVDADIAPFAMALGDRARLAGINVRGLKRRGFDHETIHALRAAYNAFFFSSGTRVERLAAVAERFGSVPAVAQFIEFIRASGDTRLILPRTHRKETDEDDEP
jgi:UDP-N-acetylglucosamine acyltransferase